MAINKKAIKISKKHLLGIQDLSISDINLILDEAKSFITLNKSKNKKIDILRGKTQINLFFEPSTRKACQVCNSCWCTGEYMGHTG